MPKLTPPDPAPQQLHERLGDPPWQYWIARVVPMLYVTTLTLILPKILTQSFVVSELGVTQERKLQQHLRSISIKVLAHGESIGSTGQMPGMEKTMKEMETLKRAKDDEFDKMFLDMMSEHHEGAVMMSKLVGNRTDRAELKQLANKIITDQNKEIEQMKGWKKSWFKN